ERDGGGCPPRARMADALPVIRGERGDEARWPRIAGVDRERTIEAGRGDVRGRGRLRELGKCGPCRAGTGSEVSRGLQGKEKGLGRPRSRLPPRRSLLQRLAVGSGRLSVLFFLVENVRKSQELCCSVSLSWHGPA